MKVIHKAIASQHICNTLLAFFATAAPASEQPATVVAHMPLSGYPTRQMDVRENGGKQYLYIGANPHEGLTVVDVTNPDQPNVIKRLAWPNEASTGRLQLVSGGLALAEGPASEAAPADPAPPTWTRKVLDLSNPANPRAILSFSGVMGTLDDEARNLVYIIDREGLWILRNSQALAAAAKRHARNSDDAYNDLASCE